MNRILILAAVVAATATDASAAGRLRARGGCGCAQTTPTAVYTAPLPAAPYHGSPTPTGMPGMVMPAPTAAPGSAVPAAPAVPGGHQHHSAAPADSTTTLVFTDTPPAAEKAAAKELKLEGTLVCAKCGLKEAGVKKCTNALQVKDGDKIVTHYLDDKGAEEAYHEGLCGGGKKEGAKVTGTVSEKDGKNWVKAKHVEEKK